MKSIVELSQAELAQQTDMMNKLKEAVKGTRQSDWFDNFKQKSGYAHYTFSGDVKEELVTMLGHEPSGNEIIMLVDGGFSHFGASCSVSGRHFSGRVHTD